MIIDIFSPQLTLSELIIRVNSGNYEAIRPDKKYFPTNHIFDENKTVKWNKEEIIKKNKECSQAIENYEKEEAELEIKFRKDLTTCIINELSLDNASDKQNNEIAGNILNFAYDLYDYSEFSYSHIVLIEVIEKILELQKSIFKTIMDGGV